MTARCMSPRFFHWRCCFWIEAFERRPFFNFTLLGLIIGLIILTPHVQLAYYSLWSLALYTIFKLVLLYLERSKNHADGDDRVATWSMRC